MMKIAIFSDSHGDSKTMSGVVEKEKLDMVLEAGADLLQKALVSGPECLLPEWKKKIISG